MLINVVMGGGEDCDTMVRWCDELVSTLHVLLPELVQDEEEFSIVLKESYVLSIQEITRVHKI